MMTAVLDTNVLASGFLIQSSVPAQLLGLWPTGSFQLVTSGHIITELEHTLQTNYFRVRLTPDQITRAINLLRNEATITPITAEVQGVATHPEDDLILATAISAQADYLVTGDTKLQHLGTYTGVTILSPREFLDLLVTQQ